MTSDITQQIAPGMRIELRSVEWLVKRKRTTGMKFHQVDVLGISEIVRDREMSFILEYEEHVRKGSVKILDPAEVTLVPDPSPRYLHTLLYIESLLRSAAPKDADLSVGQRGAVDFMEYQMKPARMALDASRPRILIADDVGLGKTIEAGVLVSELIARGRGKRILVITTKAMLTQFQKEFWVRFSIALTRLDSTVLQRVKERIPERHNPFHYFDRAIVSIDTLKNNQRFGHAIQNAEWDIIVIDEAQNVAERRRGTRRSQRARLAQTLTNRSDALLLLSATPHDGSRRSFASLMKMLSPLAITDEENYGPEDIKGLFVRRFRHHQEVQRDLSTIIPERETRRLRGQATKKEEQAFKLLAHLDLEADRKIQKSMRLFRIVLEKSLFSSPAACLESLERRMEQHRRQIQDGENPGVAQNDLIQLEKLHEAVAAIDPDSFSRYQLLLEYLSDAGWNGKDGSDRLVIFTERIPTLHWLYEHLRRDLGLRENQVVTMSGDMSDIDLQKAKEDFGLGSSRVRLLIASDIAAEGLNLHFYCHRLVHFDLPWSLMTFQQRNGRIDRYGQKHQPQVVYLYTECEETQIHNDFRIVQLLSEKEETARQNIGDAGILLGTNDQDEQEEIIAEKIETGTDSQDFERELDDRSQASGNDEYDFLEELLGGSSGAPEYDEPAQSTAEDGDYIFDSFFDYATAALRHIDRRQGLKVRVHENDRIIEMEVPSALRDPVSREPRWMPQEAVKEGLIKLTDRKELVNRDLDRAQASENSWPPTQYLWEVHPFGEWLGEQMNRVFNRREVPVAYLDETLDPNEAIFLFFGRIPNQAGSTLRDSWIGVRYREDEFHGCMTMAEILERAELRPDFHVNEGTASVSHLQVLVEDAVDKAQTRFHEEVQQLREKLDDQALKELANLEKLCRRHEDQIEQWYRRREGIQQVIDAEKQRREDEVQRWRNEFWSWFERMRQIESQLHPHTRLIAVLSGPRS